MKIRLLLSLVVLFVLTVALPLPLGLAQDFPDVCQEGGNILRNCNFDNGLDHWQPFLETGAADISILQGGGECHAPLCPAAYIVTENHFIGGIYQQVAVAKGNAYYANIVWLVFDSLVNDESINQAVGGGIGRRIGIDPFGGTDSKSSNVVWSADNWRNDCKICNVEHVTVTAQADTITVFLRLDDTWRLRAAEKGYPVPHSRDKFWIDDIGMKQVGGDAVPVEVAAPADTPVPPPDTPTPEPAPTDTPVPPADTPTPEPESSELEAEPDQPESATEVAQAETPATAAPESPVDTPTPQPTNTLPPAPPTLTPTTTPSPTHTLQPRPSATPAQNRETPPSQTATNVPVMLGAAGTTICIGSIVLLLAAVVLAGLVWLYRLGWSKQPDEDEDDFNSDES